MHRIKLATKKGHRVPHINYIQVALALFLHVGCCVVHCKDPAERGMGCTLHAAHHGIAGHMERFIQASGLQKDTWTDTSPITKPFFLQEP
jgi:hypothetical protein